MISTLLQGRNGDAVLDDWTFTSNAFFGESSAGSWTVRVTDKAAGVSGTINNLSLTAFGRAATVDSTYIFTDAFSRGGSGPYVLTDRAGNDILNASTVTSNVTIDLREGTSSTIAGRTLTISRETVIETAFGGDGNDLLIANNAGSTLWGGRGDDTLKGGAGRGYPARRLRQQRGRRRRRYGHDAARRSLPEMDDRGLIQQGRPHLFHGGSEEQRCECRTLRVR